MLYREIFAVCSQIHTKHINTPCEQNVELLNVKLVVHIVTSVLWKVLRYIDASCFCYLVGVSAMTGRMSVI